MSATEPGTAREVARLHGYAGDARVYRLDPPIESQVDDPNARKCSLVVVSAVEAPLTGPETYIFPAYEQAPDERGNAYAVDSWFEMDGSFRGGLDHERALRGAGYVVEQEGDDRVTPCIFRYRDESCGYTGPLPDCDKSFAGPNGCRTHGNAPRFGGFPQPRDL